VDFQFSPIQLELADLYGRFFAAESTSVRVRAAEPLGFDADMWAKLASLGALSMGLPEAAGGDGIGLTELAVVAEQVGRCLAPVPYIEAVTAARLVAAHAGRLSASGWEGWSTALLSGERLLTFALRPFVAGTSRLAPAGAVADAVVGLSAGALVVAETEAPADGGPARRPTVNLGSSPIADARLGSPRYVLLEGPQAAAAHSRALDEWKVLTAACLVGLAARALDMAIDYARIRKIFGTLLGSFQTAAHRFADDVVSIDGSRFLSYKAAWALDSEQPDGPTLASMAFLNATETARRVASGALHIHGGLGYTSEHDIQLYYRRAQAWPLVLGDPAHEWLQLSDRLYGPREQRG
jgi:alkylation response protein AidB-like acyl-CoA dehydrogenase